jgi:hypothetical protein
MTKRCKNLVYFYESVFCQAENLLGPLFERIPLTADHHLTVTIRHNLFRFVGKHILESSVCPRRRARVCIVKCGPGPSQWMYVGTVGSENKTNCVEKLAGYGFYLI